MTSMRANQWIGLLLSKPRSPKVSRNWAGESVVRLWGKPAPWYLNTNANPSFVLVGACRGCSELRRSTRAFRSDDVLMSWLRSTTSRFIYFGIYFQAAIRIYTGAPAVGAWR